MASEPRTELPPYQVRENPRARRVRLRFSPRRGLEVIVPRGFDRHALPGLLHDHRAWIHRQADRLAEEQACRGKVDEAPSRLALRALAESWEVCYQPGQRPPRLFERAGCGLVVQGDVHDLAACRVLLRRWLAGHGRTHLLPWLQRLSGEIGLPFADARIRGPRTRWGSCSTHKNISLSYRLLFLPPHLVRHVLVHELCHTVHLNHSPRFWALLQSIEPDYREHRDQLSGAWRYLPAWLEDVSA